MPALCYGCGVCISQLVQEENTIPSLVLGLVGGQGYFINDGDSDCGVPTMPYTRNSGSVDTVANTDGISACASDTFDAATLTFDLGASQKAQCWPWSSQVVAMVRTQYTSKATDTSSCSHGIDTLQFLQWLFTQTEMDTLTNVEDIVIAASLSPAVQAAYIAALDSVTCDGETMLVTLATHWTLTAGIADFVQALSAIGLVGCAMAAALVWHHRAHPVIRSASPLFLLLSIGGVALMFTAGFLLVATATASTCSAFSWTVNVGLMLCFAPLFAKTYRIYRIFGRKKLSVVQLSNRKLLLIVLCMLLVEAVLMAVWQGVGPIAPLSRDVTGSTINAAGNLDIQEYVQCGVPDGPSMVAFAVVCVEKGLLFVFGALMAFSTRKVSSTFNESQGISLSIYNVCFTVGIITPIIVVVSAVGDVLTLLLAFALLWIAYFTAGILFVPKLMTIYYHTRGKDQVNASVAASSLSSSGFEFLSLAAFSTLPLLLSYLAALRKHVEQVEARVTKLRSNKSSIAKPSSITTPPTKSRPTASLRPSAPSVTSAIVSPSAQSASHSNSERSVLQAPGAIASDDASPAQKRVLLTASSGSWAQHTSPGLRARTVNVSVEKKEESKTESTVTAES